MGIYTKVTWPKVDKSAICAQQDVASGGPLVLNGSFSDPSVPERVSLIDAAPNGMTRSVSISSTNDLSGRTFTVAGFQNNAPVEDTITPGPNNNTVYGSKHFDVITSVTVDNTVSAVSVGTGDTGYLPLFVVNTGTSAINYSMSVVFPPSVTTNINYSIYQTLDQINLNYTLFDNQLVNLFPISGFTNQTGSKIASYQDFTNFILIKINTSGTPLTDKFDFIFLQA